MTQTQYLYYNTGTCRGGTSVDIYKMTVKWTRAHTSFTAKGLGGTWGFMARRCDTGLEDIVSNSLAGISPVDYSKTYYWERNWPAVTNVGVWGANVGGNYKGNVYRYGDKVTTICTMTYIWASGSAC